MTLLTVSVIQWRISLIHFALKNFSPGGYCVLHFFLMLALDFALLSCSTGKFSQGFDTHSHSLNPLCSWWNILRLFTSPCHLTLSWAVHLTSCHVSCLFSNSAILVLGDPSFVLPLWVSLYGPLGHVSLWPVSSACGQSNPKLFCLIFRHTGCCPSCLQRSSLHVCLGYQFLRLLLHDTSLHLLL